MLNFRRLKQDLPSAILRGGRDLHESEAVLEAKILAVETACVRVTAQVRGSYENVHECEIEIDRHESEMTDSNCDCSHHLDCQHLAAVLFFLERRLDELLVDFSKDADLEDEDIDEEEKEKIQQALIEAQKKEESRKSQESQQELLKEYSCGAGILATSPFFLPTEEAKTDRAELGILITDQGADVQLQFALRLPYRSKPLHIPNARAFLEAVDNAEPITLSGRRYHFNCGSFCKIGWALLKRVIWGARFPEGEEEQLRVCLINPTVFGMLMADAHTKATENMGASGYAAKEDGERLALPCLYLGGLDKPVSFSTESASLRFVVEHLGLPAPKAFLKPTILLEGEEVDYKAVRVFDCCKPGVLCDNLYYRFHERIRRIHLRNLAKIEAMTIPEPLFGAFVENALPEIQRMAEVREQNVLDSYSTLPFAGELRGKCEIEYLDGELEAHLSFCYDELEVPAAPSQLTFEEANSFVGEEGILARNLVEERQIINDLFTGFIFQRETGSFIAKTEKKVVEFMTEVVPRYQEQIAFNVPSTLQDKFLYDDTQFTLHFVEGERIDQYNLELIVEGRLKGISLDRLWETITSKRTFLEIDKTKKGSKILVLDVEKLTPVVQLFDEIGLKKLDNHKEERPLWSLANLTPAHFDGLPVKMTISDALLEIQGQMLGLRPVKPSPIPKKIKATLRPYQKEGVHWLERLRLMRLSGILADDMGLGKTLQAIIALTQFHAASPGRQSIVVCPTSLLYNWKEELAKFNPALNVQVIDGTPVQRKKLIDASAAVDILISSYSLLQKDIETYEERTFGYAILDEAQHIKNRGTRNAKSVKLLKSNHRLILTGTPVENSLDELWSLFDFLMPGLLSSYDRFVEKYIRPSGEAQTKALENLSKKVTPFILRRMKCDVLKDLPPVSHIPYHCHLSDVQKELYQAYAASAREELSRLVERQGFDKVQIHVLATLTRLKQICCHPAIFAKEKAEPGDSAKYDMLLELLQNLIEGDHKSVIFSQYTRMLGIMRDDLERLGVKFAYLDGSSKNRLELVKQFNEDPTCMVFLVSLKAGGTGLNLTGADTVIHYDMWWNPAVENQATDRVHRIGQKKSVSAYKLITKGTIEEKIVQLQKRKENLVKQVVSTDDEAVSKLTWEEVLELLQT